MMMRPLTNIVLGVLLVTAFSERLHAGGMQKLKPTPVTTYLGILGFAADELGAFEGKDQKQADYQGRRDFLCLALFNVLETEPAFVAYGRTHHKEYGPELRRLWERVSELHEKDAGLLANAKDPHTVPEPLAALPVKELTAKVRQRAELLPREEIPFSVKFYPIGTNF